MLASIMLFTILNLTIVIYYVTGHLYLFYVKFKNLFNFYKPKYCPKKESKKVITKKKKKMKKKKRIIVIKKKKKKRLPNK